LTATPGALARAHIVLVGGGHAHVQVLHRFAQAPVAGVHLTVILDRREAVYSGMVPGFVAGDYAAHELEIDVAALAARAGARVVLAPAVAIDPDARRIAVDGHAVLPYDLASLDVGATVRGLALPGVGEHALATRPIRALVDRLDRRLDEVSAHGGGRVRLAIVGAGAAGVELAFTLRARLRARGADPAVTVLSSESGILAGYPRRVAARAVREAERRDIAIRTAARAVAVEAGDVVLDRSRVPSDLTVWATGAAPLPFPGRSPLPTDAKGFVRVRATLEVEGYEGLFAVGDCASIEGAPWVRKAGVYAVRQGPILDANLRARMRGARLVRYRPQRHVLSLLNLGGREALAAKWGAVVVGRWVWRWKDAIDRRFIARFRPPPGPLRGPA
jgi:pyridine nucleotide-disulfide oxidoreductase family protein